MLRMGQCCHFVVFAGLDKAHMRPKVAPFRRCECDFGSPASMGSRSF